MKDIFIKGYNKRYSINEKGEVHNHYNHHKESHYLLMIPYVPLVKSESPRVVLYHINKKDRGTTKVIKTLMKEAFNLKRPDVFHFYDLINKDNNIFNNKLSNLEWRIRLHNKFKFYPQCFYNSKNEIIQKICIICGEKKDISNFTLAPHKRTLKSGIKKIYYSYQNHCHCSSSRKSTVPYKNSIAYKTRWERLKKDLIKLEEHRQRGREYGRLKTTKVRQSILKKKSRLLLTDSAIRKYLTNGKVKYGLKCKDITDQMIKIMRKNLILYRQLQQYKLKN